MTESRTERKKRLTRRRLIDAGRDLITVRGVGGIRIQELTERADVGLGSFYNYFPSKEDLVEAVVAESLAELAAATIPAEWDHEDPAEVAAAAFLRFIRLASDDPTFASLVVNLSNSETLFGVAVQPYARATLERGVEMGRFRLASMDVALSASIGGAFGLIRELLDGRHGSGTDEAFARHALVSFGIEFEEAAAIVVRMVSRLEHDHRVGDRNVTVGLEAQDPIDHFAAQ
ncbi:TetR/AcrR family transcriptional regulator; helix-turn-helix transcriptional regulator [Actinomycetospora endophytica]|uniref:TetR/AcrR family transcriptional regulator helix-turn-helix transcriptional regulator n=1 Tax=Actinomycetospora endophytica TaxID=2291215 RepID=A0ABS8PJ16_9PSEU|nr:TetR/AcrR family transcriptional regulator [Actinomycetospora endophytica]MCD2198250.1 TetR/AcrR family transcriptional regulator; helix-turn-helix transcriptional regulator [Actinomycetospora endophytica]